MKTKKTIKMNIPDYWGVGAESPFKPIKVKPEKKTKSAITSLDRGQHWNSQFWISGKQFSWTKDKPIPKKDMNYKQANQFFSLSPISDTDRDGVPNWRDCRPYDPLRQGKHWDVFKEKVAATTGKVREKLQPHPKQPVQTTPADFPTTPTKAEGKTPKAPIPTPAPAATPTPVWYMFVKFANRKWEQVAVLKQGEIKGAVEDFKKNFPNVEDVQLSQNPKLLGKLNRSLALQHAKKAVSKYAKKQQFKEHIKEGVKPKTSNQDLEQKISAFGGRPIGVSPVTSRSSLVGLERPFGGEGGVPSSQPQTVTSTPQQTVKINIPQSFGGPQSIDTRAQTMQPAPPELEGEEMLELEEGRAPEMTSVESDEELPEGEEHRRVIPPGVQPYAPVTREQSTISRPLLRAPFHDKLRPVSMSGGGKIVSGRMLHSATDMSSSRPKGIIPMVELRQAPPIRFMTFGRKVKR